MWQALLGGAKQAFLVIFNSLVATVQSSGIEREIDHLSQLVSFQDQRRQSLVMLLSCALHICNVASRGGKQDAWWHSCHGSMLP
jgi:hypothetical protein